MRLIKSPSKMQRVSKVLKRADKSIGFVPTMGYLHEGHLCLIRRARSENDVVVVSIFVNPAQFAPGEDYKRYPRNLLRDKRLAASCGTDIIFHPGPGQMYPEAHAGSVHVKGLTDVMCGISRPGHFDGVCTVCAKLFNIVRPDTAYFGQKDYQQALVIKRMVQDLNMGFKLKILPIVREKDGLAMSSRNSYLSRSQRNNAAVIYASLKRGESMIRSGTRSAADIKKSMRSMILGRPGMRIDYITIADPYTLKEKKAIRSRALIALAVWAGETRLIDNILVRAASRPRI